MALDAAGVARTTWREARAHISGAHSAQHSQRCSVHSASNTGLLFGALCMTLGIELHGDSQSMKHRQRSSTWTTRQS